MYKYMYIYMYLENHVVSELAQKCMYMYMSVTVIGHYWDISKILYWYTYNVQYQLLIQDDQIKMVNKVISSYKDSTFYHNL